MFKRLLLFRRSGLGARPATISAASGFAAAAAAIVVLAGCTTGQAQDQTPPPPPEVTAAKVLVRDIHRWADFTGRLEAVSRVDVQARVAGYVERVAFDEGARVAAGDLLFQIDPRPFQAEVDRLEAERVRARAQLRLARSNRERAERLYAQNATSREELESLTANAAVAEAQLAAVGAALESAELNLSFTRVTAPIAGRVSRAIVTAGNLIDSSTLLTTVVSDDPIYVYFDADEHTYLDQVRGSLGGAEQSIAYVGLINEEGYPHKAKLDFVDNRVDPDQGTIRVRAVLDNPDGALTPGLFARLRVVAPDSYHAALVDDRAIGTDLGHKFVLTLGADNVAQYRAVETGPLVDDLRVVSSGLEAGDLVIVNGLQRVRPGMPVAPKEVAMGEHSTSQQLERLAATPKADKSTTPTSEVLVAHER